MKTIKKTKINKDYAEPFKNLPSLRVVRGKTDLTPFQVLMLQD